MSNTIHCIGDSHACFFGGNGIFEKWPYYKDHDIFRAYRVGAALAYNLQHIHSTSNGRQKLFEILENIEKKSRVLLVFGEIDCRAHLLKQAKKKNKTFEEITSECVKAYFKTVLEIKNMKFDVGVWGPIASTYLSANNSQKGRKIVGTTEERNLLTRFFNVHLEKRCKQENIKFISIFKDLIDEQLKTKTEFYIDHIHLGSQAMSLAKSAIKNVWE